MINRSFYLIHEQVENKRKKKKKRKNHDKIIHTLRKEITFLFLSLTVDRKLCFINNQYIYGRIETLI